MTRAVSESDRARTAAELRLVLGRLARRLRAISGTGLSASQLSALVTLEEHGALRLRDLARAEGVRPPSATRLVDPLVERGLVLRASDPTDARGTLVSLTEQGRAALGRQRAERSAALAAALARLTGAQQDQLAASVPLLEALLVELQAPALAGAAR